MQSMLRQFKKLPGIRSIIPDQGSRIFSPGICSIGILSDEVCLAYAQYSEGKIELQFIETYLYKNINEFSRTLSAAIKRHQLEGVPCRWVLPPERYQALLIDALPVKESEFQSAIRWKIKSLLQYPEDDVVIDSFPLPLQKTHDPREMIIAVTAQVSFLQPYIDKIRESGLQLNIIDIQQLALRNITSLFEDDEKTTALIYLRDKASELIITCQKDLYFHRHLELDLSTATQTANLNDENAPNPELDRTALELQRSFDYYQSQWRKPAPARVLLATATKTGTAIATYLSNRLAFPIQLLDIHANIKSKQALNMEDQGRYLSVIGALLRNESP